MKRNNYTFIGLGILILGIGFFLRYKNHALIPRPGESTDEYSNSWVGMSLIELGLPVGRSGLVGYGGNDYRYVNVDRIFSTTAGGNPLGINKPWLDHPPLLPLLTGGYAHLTGARVFEDAVAGIIRKPMLVLGVITIGLLGYLTLLVSGPVSSLLAMALYATSPLMVVTSRMIQGENGVVIGFLLTLIFLYQYFERKRRLFLWLAAFATGLAFMFKVSGISAAICGAILILGRENKPRRLKFWEAALFLTVSGSFLALFFVYGAVFDWSTFVNVWSSNATRPYDIGFGSMFDLLTTTKITVSKHLTEGWPLVGWISACLLISRRTKKLFSFLVLPIVVYLVIFLLMGGSSYGWYRLPFMPFLFASLAVILAEGLGAKYKLLQVFLMLVPLGMTVHKLSEAHQMSFVTPYWRYLLPLSIVWFLLVKTKKLNQVLYVMLLTLAIGANIALSYSLTPEFWLKIN